MVDVSTVALVVLTGISTTWAILTTLVVKRKEVRTSLGSFRQQVIERLDQENRTWRTIVFLMIVGIGIGAGLSFYFNAAIAWGVAVVGFLAWIFIGAIIFGNPVEGEEPPMTKSEVEKLVEEKLRRLEKSEGLQLRGADLLDETSARLHVENVGVHSIQIIQYAVGAFPQKVFAPAKLIEAGQSSALTILADPGGKFEKGKYYDIHVWTNKGTKFTFPVEF